jgi:hypothetical protein
VLGGRGERDQERETDRQILCGSGAQSEHLPRLSGGTCLLVSVVETKMAIKLFTSEFLEAEYVAFHSKNDFADMTD